MVLQMFVPIVAAGLDPMEEVLPRKLAVLMHNEPGSLSYKLFGPELALTNNMVMTVVVAGLMVILFPYLAARARRSPVPTGVHNLFEAILSFLRTEVFRPALGDNTDRFLPYLWTVFFFVLLSNLMGLVPGVAIIELVNHWTGWGIPLFWGAATGNVMVTAGLALFSFLLIHLGGIAQQVRIAMDPSLAPHHAGHDNIGPHGHGGTLGAVGPDAERDVRIEHHVGNGHDHAHGLHHGPQGASFPVALVKGFLLYWWNFAPHTPAALWFFMLPLELIGALVKPFALCMRLFANIMAGHVVLASLVGLIFVAQGYAMRGGVGIAVIVGCALLSILEVFVAFLQAYIFTFLTTLFLASAVAPEH